MRTRCAGPVARTAAMALLLAGAALGYAEGGECPCQYLGIGVPWSEYAEPAKLSALVDGRAEAYLLLDVREPGEYAAGHIRTAVNAPVGGLGATPPDWPKDGLIIVYCKAGARSARAAAILKGLGFRGVIDFSALDRWAEDLEID